MKKKHGVTGTGSYHNDVTRDINRANVVRMNRNIKASDAWRKAKEDDPTIEFRMSFAEYKKMYFRPKKKSSGNKKRKN